MKFCTLWHLLCIYVYTLVYVQYYCCDLPTYTLIAKCIKIDIRYTRNSRKIACHHGMLFGNVSEQWTQQYNRSRTDAKTTPLVHVKKKSLFPLCAYHSYSFLYARLLVSPKTIICILTMKWILLLLLLTRCNNVYFRIL